MTTTPPLHAQALNAELMGGGPDYAEVDVYCPAKCGWSHTFDTDRPGGVINIGMALDMVACHLVTHQADTTDATSPQDRRLAQQ